MNDLSEVKATRDLYIPFDRFTELVELGGTAWDKGKPGDPPEDLNEIESAAWVCGWNKAMRNSNSAHTRYLEKLGNGSFT